MNPFPINEHLEVMVETYRKSVGGKAYYDASAYVRKTSESLNLPPWYTVVSGGIKFHPGVLAEHLSKDECVFYAAEQHYRYADGLYDEMSDMQSQRMV